MHAATRNRQDNKLTILGYFFFFNDTATTEIYTLSLHDALPIYLPRSGRYGGEGRRARCRLDSGPHALRRVPGGPGRGGGDRKSTRLNSSHGYISYAVFCLKKKNAHPRHLDSQPHSNTSEYSHRS